MLAQEAIEKLQKRIGNMQIVLNEMGLQILKHGVTESLNHEIYSELESEIEALSIVLESARLLHSEGINPGTASNGVLVIERFISEKDFEKLGIEEGADE